MNALTRDLIKLVDMTEEMMKEKGQKEGADYREKLHLMPPVGWLNDPNGLCQLNGIYHAFFQYSPFNAEGGVKMWGHYTSKDMIDWEYQGVKLYPDQPFDCHGVYSGSAFIEDDKMYVYYTGNVKLEDGDFDYINTGRESNTVLVVSEDGKTFGSKKELMRNVDYPSDLTCHVRDPKVWKDGDTYYMIQGARTKEDVGQALIFESKDKINWKFRSRVESKKPFGYMWECPDYFEVDGTKILSAYVQEFEVAEDGIVEQPRIISGAIIDSYMKMAALSELNMHFVNSHFIHPDDLLDEDRGAALGWEKLKGNLSDYMDWLDDSAPSLRQLTGSELSGAIQRYGAVTFTKTVTDQEIRLELDNFYDEVYFMVRINEGTPGDVSGGKLTHLTGNLYLLKAKEPTVTIEKTE